MTAPPDLLLYQTLGADASAMLGAPDTTPGTCHRCGSRGPTWGHRRIVTSKFTGWDTQTHMVAGGHSTGWCARCAWLHKDASLRRQPIIASAGGRVQVADRAALHAALSRPFGLTWAASVPITGRKHVAPSIRWGAVACDTATVPWTGAEAAMITDYVYFRGLGVSRTEMAAETPPWRLTSTRQESLQTLLVRWETLRIWKGAPAWEIASRWL